MLCVAGCVLAGLYGALEAEIGCGVVLDPASAALLLESEPEVSVVDAPSTFPPLYTVGVAVVPGLAGLKKLKPIIPAPTASNGKPIAAA